MDKEAPLITVIMPCYNAAAFIEEAISSVLNQTYNNIELIIIDDGSSDESTAIVNRQISQHPESIKILLQDHKGPYPARNLGLDHARGEYVAFLDADDWWRLDCLEFLYKAMAIDDAAVAYCGWQNIGLDGPRGEPYTPPDYETGNKLETFLRAAAPWPIHAALVRHSVIKEIGGFDLALTTCMDYDLWLRIGSERTIRLVPEVMAFYRHHTLGQITSKQWIQARNSWLVKKKFITEHPALTSRIPKTRLRELVDGGLIRRGYDAYWKRDLVSAQKIFRLALRTFGWKISDLKYLLPSLLPQKLYFSLIKSSDRISNGNI